jgi:stalled ribosome rescue protein Dom34
MTWFPSTRLPPPLRPLLKGLGIPLILAAAEPMYSIFRSVNSYPDLAATGIPGNPEAIADSQLAARARTILDDLYAAQVGRLRDAYEALTVEGRALGDVAQVARAATLGAVDTVLVDIDSVVPGVIDEHTGAVTFAEGDGVDSYGVVDEIARRVLRNGGRVLAVRRQDVPGEGDVAAILRFPL